MLRSRSVWMRCASYEADGSGPRRPAPTGPQRTGHHRASRALRASMVQSTMRVVPTRAATTPLPWSTDSRSASRCRASTTTTTG
jgi:hypothetical protein